MNFDGRLDGVHLMHKFDDGSTEGKSDQETNKQTVSLILTEELTKHKG